MKHTEIVTKEAELKLWTSGVMGVDTPRSLQNAAFYIVGKMFSLRGGVEHRLLKLSQISRVSNPDQYVYHETYLKSQWLLQEDPHEEESSSNLCIPRSRREVPC